MIRRFEWYTLLFVFTEVMYIIILILCLGSVSSIHSVKIWCVRCQRWCSASVCNLRFVLLMWMNNYVDRSCVRHFTSSVVSYFSGGLLVCHCYTSRRWITILSVPFVGYCFLWCVSYVRSRISWMGCLHISNRYSRIWFGCVLSSYTSFFQML